MAGRLSSLLPVVAVAAAAVFVVPCAAQPREFDIPASEASEAIKLLGRQSDLQILAPSADLQGVRANSVKGLLEPRAALEWLIEGTELELVPAGDGAFIVRRKKPQKKASALEEELVKAPPALAAHIPQRTSEPVYKLPAVDKIVVTGSRLDRGGAAPVLPTIVETADDIGNAGFVNVGDAIEDIPGFGVSDSNPTGGQATFGVGQTLVNFLGLGSQRTLTLVNGRRYVSSVSAAGSGSAGPAGQQVDLNLIPASLIDRVETIAIGGAPVYGSDAVAGVVNIVLKDKFSGVRGKAQYGVTQRGDAQEVSLSGLAGGDFFNERGSALLNVEYTAREGLLESDREFLRKRRFFAPNPADTGPADGVPSLIVIENQVLAGVTDGGLPLPPGGTPGGWTTPAYPQGFFIRDAQGRPVQFAPDGTLVPYTLGTGGGDAPVFVSGGDGVNISENFSLIAPTQRLLINGLGTYEVSPSLNAFVELSYAHTESEESRELLAISTAVIPQDGPIHFTTANPFLSKQAREVIEANGLSEFDLSRNLGDLFDHIPGNSRLDVYRVVAGLEGTLNDETAWDVSINYGRSDNRSEIPYINDARFNAAIDAVINPASGEIVCAEPTMPDCAPLNLFGEQTASDAAIAFVTETGSAKSINEQFILTANFGGTLPIFNSRGVGFSIGAEHRREYAAFLPDEVMAQGSIRTPPFVSVGGSFRTYEAYAEARLPLIAPEANMAFVDEFSLEASARYIHHSQAGGDVTWTTAATFAPRLPAWAQGALLRAVFTHAIRAPAATELFLNDAPVRATANDPCDRRFFQAGSDPYVREANCRDALAASGAGDPADFISDIVGIGVIGTQGGNPRLGNEEADSWSFGVAWRPAALPQVALSADWINVSLAGGAAVTSVGQILAACYDSPSYPYQDECAAFTRGTGADAGQIVDYHISYDNISQLDFRGLMLASDVRFDLRNLFSSSRDFGKLRARARLFYVDRYAVRASPNEPAVNGAGLVGIPRVETQASLRYDYDRLDLSLRAAWSSSTRLDNDITPEISLASRADSHFLLGATAGYAVTPNVRAQLSVANLLDTPPPPNALIGSSAGARRSYDTLGRRFSVAIMGSF